MTEKAIGSAGRRGFVVNQPDEDRNPTGRVADSLCTFFDQHLRIVLPGGRLGDLVIAPNAQRLQRPRLGCVGLGEQINAEPENTVHFLAYWPDKNSPSPFDDSPNTWITRVANVIATKKAANLHTQGAVACAPDGSWVELNLQLVGATDRQADDLATAIGLKYFGKWSVKGWEVLKTGDEPQTVGGAPCALFDVTNSVGCPATINPGPRTRCKDPGGPCGRAAERSAFWQAQRKLDISFLQCQTCANGANRDGDNTTLIPDASIPTRSQGWALLETPEAAWKRIGAEPTGAIAVTRLQDWFDNDGGSDPDASADRITAATPRARRAQRGRGPRRLG